MIEVGLEIVVADFLDNLGEEAEEALLARVLVIEGRQHEHAAAAELDRVIRQQDGISERAHARARHELGCRDARFDDLLQHLHALVDAE